MKTHLMIKRNWFVCLFTKYKYYMACNSKRKFLMGNFCWDKKGNDIYGEEINIFNKPFVSFSIADNKWEDVRIDVCQNCTRTKYYKENK